MTFGVSYLKSSRSTLPVTILMSVHNGEHWLSESVQSVLDQTFMDFEFIIVDDGSTDGSLRLIKHFADADPRIQVFDKPNTGLADSLNYGIERAQGEWIARIDADDLWDVSKLRRQISLVNAREELALVGTGLRFLDIAGNQSKAYIYPNRHKTLVNHLKCDRRFFPHSSAFFKAETVRNLNNYRKRFRRSQDRDLWLRLSEVGELACIPESLVLIRKHGNQISQAEGGRLQLIDSHVAMVSYWLRQMQHEDPVDSLPDLNFSEFRNWVELEMESAGVFEAFHRIAEIKSNMRLSNSNHAKYASLLASVISSPQQSYRWLSNRLFGSSLPKLLAINWMSKSH